MKYVTLNVKHINTFNCFEELYTHTSAHSHTSTLPSSVLCVTFISAASYSAVCQVTGAQSKVSHTRRAKLMPQALPWFSTPFILGLLKKRIRILLTKH
jgi:hypothetical protein